MKTKIKTVGKLGNFLYDLLGSVVGISSGKNCVQIMGDKESMLKVKRHLVNKTLLTQHGQVKGLYILSIYEVVL